MSVFFFLAIVAAFFILTAPLYRSKRAAAAFDPGSPPAAPLVTREPLNHDNGIELGDGIYWHPQAHPNPHVLMVGASGTGKSWTIRLLAQALLDHGFSCALIDFHGDLAIRGATSHRIALDSQFGVNPLVVFLDPSAGGPDPQRIEVLDQLRNAFRPMGSVQLALLDDCLKETYRKAGIDQHDPQTWRASALPHFGHLREELEGRTAQNPKDLRAQTLRTKLSLAFDFGIFSKPEVPFRPELRESPKGLRLDLSSLPPPLQYLAADTFLKQIFRYHQLAGIRPVDTYVFVDESKLCTPQKKDSPLGALNRIVTEGRKFGLGLIVSSQFVGHLPRDVVVNTFTKMVMRTDKTEIAPTARKFRIEETLVEALQHPGEALINFADSTEWKELRIGRQSRQA